MDEKKRIDDPMDIVKHPPNISSIPTPPLDESVNHCYECEYFMPFEKAREQMKREHWWEHVFRGYGDGHDWKLYEIGDVNAYSMCDYMGRGAKVHFAAPCCEYFILRKTIAKIILKR